MDLKKLIQGALLVARSVLVGMGEGSKQEVRDKRTVDISTVGDRAVSEALIRYFRQAEVPGVLLSEESGCIDLCRNPEFTVVFDDIDGTDNFFRGMNALPYCTVVAILDGTRPRFCDTLAAGVLEHRTGMMWHAEREKGCVLDGTQVHTASTDILSRRSVVIIDHYGSIGSIARFGKLHADAWVKDFGSSGFHLAGVAAGIFDGFVNAGQKGHELAAGYLLLREAGGVLCNFKGQLYGDRPYSFGDKNDVIAACNRAFADLLVAAVKEPV